jgi:three-Cys-motif partner protein
LEPATGAKHKLYQRYYDAWWPIMLQPQGMRSWSRVTLLDAFAGPGLYEAGEDGSPVFSLQRLLEHDAAGRMGLSPRRVQLVFIEKRRDRYEHLRQLLTDRFGALEQLPVRVIVRQGEAGRDSEGILTEVGAWGQPILGVFDSWGSVRTPLTLMRRIARNPGSEVITTFGPNWFNRRKDINSDIFDEVFGGRQFWEAASAVEQSDEQWRAWLAAYRSALLRAGFGYCLQFQVVPRTGLPLHLVFGTCHPKGVAVMKEAMWTVDRSDGMSFKDPRCRGAVPIGQGTLWESEVIDPELVTLVHDRLKQGAITVGDLGQWLLTETAQWQAKDAAKAVQHLRDEQLALVSPAGRITKGSTVSLR